jgi:hypothetical protein
MTFAGAIAKGGRRPAAAQYSREIRGLKGTEPAKAMGDKVNDLE